MTTELCEIMGRHGSDKGSASGDSWHNYTQYYDSLWSKQRTEKLRVFELGLGTNNTALPSNMGAAGKPGASLRGWAEYFPNATVFGADIDKDILFRSERIDTFYCDQRSVAAISEMWAQPQLESLFDIIIDDGLHQYDANVTFFENSVQKLAPNGVYIIEDICNADCPLFMAKISEWRQKYGLSVEFVPLASAVNRCDNALIVIRRP